MLKHYSVLRDLSQNGALAQLGERLLCTQEVRSSNLLGSIDDGLVVNLFFEN